MKMKKVVRVVDRSTWGTSQPYPLIREIEVEWKCPVCNETMGETKEHVFYENGDTHVCDVWKNKCGHVVKYEDLLKAVN
jgi:hypothetical protein